MSTAIEPPLRLYLPKLHPTQIEIKQQAARFNVLDLGRRSGKNVLGVDLAVQSALKGQPVGWFAPTFNLLADAWRDLKATLRVVITDKSETEHRLELLGGGIVECWSMDNQDPARGRKYGRVIIDEVAIVRNMLAIWQEAIRPTLSDLEGDAFFLSTPKGLNDFWHLFRNGEDPEQHDWRSWKRPTACNPFISPNEIEAARQELPERVFAQEYLAEFLADGAGVFRGVQGVSTASTQDREDGHAYVMGVDWGKIADFTVLSVIDATTRTQVLMDRFNRIDYAFQTQRLMQRYQEYRPRSIAAEKNSIGEPLIESLARMGLPVTPWTATNATKASVIEGLSLAIERNDVTLLDDPVQVGELLAYDAERLPSGLLRYGAPAGMHDDCVIALALAWEGANNAPRRESTQYDPRSPRAIQSRVSRLQHTPGFSKR